MFKEAIDFYDNWKENYYEQLIRTKTHYTNICNKWVQFSIKTKKLLEGLPEPSVPIGTDMKKFYEQVGYLEWLTKESEDLFKDSSGSFSWYHTEKILFWKDR